MFHCHLARTGRRLKCREFSVTLRSKIGTAWALEAWKINDSSGPDPCVDNDQAPPEQRTYASLDNRRVRIRIATDSEQFRHPDRAIHAIEDFALDRIDVMFNSQRLPQ